MKWFAISKYRGGVKVLKFWIVCPLKTLISGRSKHLKNSFKILANTFSDSLAILKKKFAGWRRQIFFHTKIPGSLLVPITLSELWEWLFPFPSYDSLWERTPLEFQFPFPQSSWGKKKFLGSHESLSTARTSPLVRKITSQNSSSKPF